MTGHSPFRPPSVLSFRVDDDAAASTQSAVGSAEPRRFRWGAPDLDDRGSNDDGGGRLGAHRTDDHPPTGAPLSPEPALDRLGTDFSPTPPSGIDRDRSR